MREMTRLACVFVLACALAGCRTPPGGEGGGVASPAGGVEEEGEEVVELPPVDRTCETVDDCEHSHISYEIIDGHPRCCYRCSVEPVSRSWWEEAHAICDELGKEGCDQVKCKTLMPSIDCVDGECVHVKPE